MISSLLLDVDADRYVTLDTAAGGAKAPTDDPAANKATEIRVRGDMIQNSCVGGRIEVMGGSEVHRR